MRRSVAYILQDKEANKGYPKSQFVLALFRVTALSKKVFSGRLGIIPRTIFAVQYKLLSEWLLGIELPSTTQVGPRLKLRHGTGTVVNPSSVIGRDVMIRHNVTIGNKRSEYDCPRVGDGVAIGAGAVIVGEITIGNRATIGPLAFVDFDVPEDAVVVSARATLIHGKVIANE